MTAGLALVGFIILQRLGELAWARRNTARFVVAGGREVGSEHYPLIVAFHAAWLLAVTVAAWHAARFDALAFAIFALCQVARVCVLVSLGRRWTTRIIVVPDRPLVGGGPYRFVRHPNYLIVAAELAALPMVFGAWPVALAFAALHVPLIVTRIAVEDRALRGWR